MITNNKLESFFANATTPLSVELGASRFTILAGISSLIYMNKKKRLSKMIDGGVLDIVSNHQHYGGGCGEDGLFVEYVEAGAIHDDDSVSNAPKN